MTSGSSPMETDPRQTSAGMNRLIDTPAMNANTTPAMMTSHDEPADNQCQENHDQNRSDIEQEQKEQGTQDSRKPTNAFPYRPSPCGFGVEVFISHGPTSGLQSQSATRDRPRVRRSRRVTHWSSSE